MIQNAIELWHGFGAETKAAIVGGGSTIFAAAVGALAIILQIRHQGNLTRSSIKEGERRRIKAKMYQEVVDACAEFSEAQGALVAAIMSAAGELKIAAEMNAEGLPSPVPRARIMPLSAMCSEYQSAVHTFLAIIGQSKFVDPRIDIFATAFSCESDGVRESFHQEFFPFTMRLLPVDRPDGQGIAPYQPPTLDQAAVAWRLAGKVVGHVHNATGYALDLSVEMQNLLVADLFGTKVEHRVPVDPAIKVIRLEDFEELDRYFRDDTEWGRRLAAQREALISAAGERPTVET